MTSAVVGMMVIAEVKRIVGMVCTVLISYEKTWRWPFGVNQIVMMEGVLNTAAGELGYRSPGFDADIRLVDVDIGFGTARGTPLVAAVPGRPGTVVGSLDTVAPDPGRILLATVHGLANFEKTRTQLATLPRQKPLSEDGLQRQLMVVGAPYVGTRVTVGEIVLDGGVATPVATQKMNWVGLGLWGCAARIAMLVRGCSTAGCAPCTDRMVALAGTS